MNTNTKKFKPNLRAVPVTSSIADAISGGYGDLTELRDEVRDIVDNAPEGLADSQRIQTLGETADELDNYADSEPDVPSEGIYESLKDAPAHWTENRLKSRSRSRATRRDEAVTMLQAAVDGIQQWMDDQVEAKADADVSDAQQLMGDVQEAIDSAEGVEFPGMFG